LRPFIWDYVTFVLSGLPQTPDWSHFKAWYMKWFDSDDHNALNDEGFFGVVHFAADPEILGNTTRVIVDFGSAPVEAFVGCVTAFCETGAKTIEVG
jgi:hypothetical protein